MTLVFAPGALVGQELADTAALPPVVVTATRVPTPRAAVAQAIIVITGTELRAQGIRTVADALRQLPSAAIVATGSFGGQTSLFLRGGESDYVKVLLDGVPLNQPGGAFDWADLTTDNVERIEVVRGPLSVLYGSDAVAGVVQIFTREGRGPIRPAADFRFGTGERVLTADERCARADEHYASTQWVAGASGVSGPVSLAVSASKFETEGMLPYNNDYRNTVLSGRMRVAPDPRTEVSMTVRFGDNVFHFPTDGAGNLTDCNQFQARRGPAISLAFARLLASRVEARVLLGLHDSDGRFPDDPDGPGDTLGIFAFQSREELRRALGEVSVDVDLAPGTVLTLGAGLERARLRSSNTCQADFGDCSGAPLDTVRTNLALFAQMLAAIGPALSLTMGARFEDNSQFGSHRTYRLGAAYRLGRATRLRATIGSGFKEPTFFENFATGFVTGNPDLNPERSFSWEVGVERALAGGRLAVSATYFEQHFDSLIEFDLDFTRTPDYFNVAGATADGVELGLEGSLGRGVTAGLGYTYLRTRVTMAGPDTTESGAFAPGRVLLRRPAHAGTLRLGYRFPTRGVVTLAARVVGEREDLDFSTFPFPRVTLSPYTRADLAAQYTLWHAQGARPGLTLQVRVENLFDDRTREVANFPARGRFVLFGGEVRYGH